MDHTLVGMAVVSGQGVEPRERIERVQQRADQLLAALADETVIEPAPDLAAGTSQSLHAFDANITYDGPTDTVVIDADRSGDIDIDFDDNEPESLAADTIIEAAGADTEIDDIDLGLDTISTAPAVAGQLTTGAMTAHTTPPRRSRLGALWAAIKGWFSRSPAPVESDEYVDDDECWTYTVSERRVAQVRAHRR